MHSFEKTAAKKDDQKCAGTKGQANIRVTCSGLFQLVQAAITVWGGHHRTWNSGAGDIFLPQETQSWLEARKAGKLLLFICHVLMMFYGC